jgi:hypothetical protein
LYYGQCTCTGKHDFTVKKLFQQKHVLKFYKILTGPKISKNQAFRQSKHYFALYGPKTYDRYIPVAL